MDRRPELPLDETDERHVDAALAAVAAVAEEPLAVAPRARRPVVDVRAAGRPARSSSVRSPRGDRRGPCAARRRPGPATSPSASRNSATTSGPTSKQHGPIDGPSATRMSSARAPSSRMRATTFGSDAADGAAPAGVSRADDARVGIGEQRSGCSRRRRRRAPGPPRSQTRPSNSASSASGSPTRHTAVPWTWRVATSCSGS